MRRALGRFLGPIVGTAYYLLLLLVNLGRKRERTFDPGDKTLTGTLIRRARWLPPSAAAITFGSTIFTIRLFPSSRLLRHEFEHVRQWKRLGWVGFLKEYGGEMLTVGYDHNHLEVKAREVEQ